MDAPARFGHPPATLRFWRSLVRPLLGREVSPFYLFSQLPIELALRELDQHLHHLPVRHWLSCKTQPLRPLLAWWRGLGRPIEVVSEFELLAALHEGFSPESILVNGPAKHHWLPRHRVRGLRVNFDSVAEVQALAGEAKRLGWITGVRLHTSEEHDPENPGRPTQFGMVADELARGVRLLRRAGVPPQIIHFHLRTNVASAAVYERAVQSAAALCDALALAPRFVDLGGGFPPPHVATRAGQRLDARFRLAEVAAAYERALQRFPGAEEIWLENGRWLTARSGVLVVKVLDVKERHGVRHLICDGGRTTQALVSTWEAHEVLALPERRGRRAPTVVNGPTCMAFDQVACRPLPSSLRSGDHLVWLDAGAYHLPWETRFSHGLAPVFWHDGRRVREVRRREPFANWWRQWV